MDTSDVAVGELSQAEIHPRWKVVNTTLKTDERSGDRNGNVARARTSLIYRGEAGRSSDPFASAESGHCDLAQQVDSEESIRIKLNEMSCGDEVVQGDHRTTNGVYDSIAIKGDHVRLNAVALNGLRVSGDHAKLNVVSLESVVVTGDHNQGLVYVPRGVKVSDDGDYNGYKVVRKALSEILQLALQFEGDDSGVAQVVHGNGNTQINISAGQGGVAAGNISGTTIVIGNNSQVGSVGNRQTIHGGINMGGKKKKWPFGL